MSSKPRVAGGRKAVVFLSLALVGAFVLALAFTANPVCAGGDPLWEYNDQVAQSAFFYTYGDHWTAQTFAVSSISHTVSSIKLVLRRNGSGTGTYTVAIRAVDANELPTGSDLTSATFDGNSITADYINQWYVFSVTPYTLNQFTKYAIVLRSSGGDTSNNVGWKVGLSTQSPFYSRSVDGGTSWTSYSITATYEIWGDEIEVGGETSGAIIINGNTALADNANGGGSGTFADPYIIENYSISASSGVGIRIENTTSYFIVKNCLIENGGSTAGRYAIKLDNVVNGTIAYNTLGSDDTTKNYAGVWLHDCENDNITANYIYSYYASIAVVGSSYIRMAYNDVTCTKDGGQNITIDGAASGMGTSRKCYYNVIDHNTAHTISGGGTSLQMDPDSSHTTVTNNTVGGLGVGIYSYQSAYNIIVNNLVENINPLYYSATQPNGAILMGYDNYSLIENNTVRNFYRSGIYIAGIGDNVVANTVENAAGTAYGIFLGSYHSPTASNCIVTLNIIGGTTTDGRDNGTTNLWYRNGAGNYWDNWQPDSGGRTDANYDGVVDTPYLGIIGGMNVDSYPLVIEYTGGTTAMVATYGSSNVGTTTATLGGILWFNDETRAITVSFDIVDNAGYSFSYTVGTFTKSIFPSVPFAHVFTGLSPSTFYTFRTHLYIAAAGIHGYGSWMVFFTLGTPQPPVSVPAQATITALPAVNVDNTTEKIIFDFFGITAGYGLAYCQISTDTNLSTVEDTVYFGSYEMFYFTAGDHMYLSKFLDGLTPGTTYYYRPVANIMNVFFQYPENIYGSWFQFTMPNAGGVITPPTTPGINLTSWADVTGNLLFGGVTMADGTSSAHAEGGMFLAMILMLMLVLPLVYLGMPSLGTVAMIIIIVGFTSLIGWMPAWITLVVGLGFSIMLAKMFAGM